MALTAMAVIAAIFSDHFLFFLAAGHDGIAAYQRLDVLASDNSLLALGARCWSQFTISSKTRS